MKLFISYINNKFINNILANKIENLEILSGSHRGVLYKISEKYNINSFIFSVSLLDNEILQFIQDYSKKYQIFLYHDQYRPELIENITDIKHLTHTDPNNRVSIVDTNILIPELINTNLFYNRNLERIDKIVCFVDNMLKIDSELSSILLPNKKLKLKLYGGKFSHAQNIGMVDENDKALILNTHKYFLSINNYYSNEAASCGCQIYNSISELMNNSFTEIKFNNIKTYSEFLIEILT